MVTPQGGILDHAIEYPNFKIIVFFQACISSVYVQCTAMKIPYLETV